MSDDANATPTRTAETYEVAQASGDKTFLRFIYCRMINIHKEDPNTDYMQTLWKFIELLETPPHHKGLVYSGQLSMKAWTVVSRLEPPHTKFSEPTEGIVVTLNDRRQSLAIAAQMAFDWGVPTATTDSIHRRKLTKIQQVLDGDL